MSSSLTYDNTTIYGDLVILDSSNTNTGTTSGSLVNFGNSGLFSCYANGYYRHNILTDSYTPLQFGSNFYYNTSPGTIGSSSTTFINKCSFTTGSLDTGQYILDFSCQLSTTLAGTPVGFRVYQNGNTAANALIFTGSQTIESATDIVYQRPFTIMNITTGGIYTYAVDTNRPGGLLGTAMFGEVNFLIYRVNDVNTG